MFSRSHGQLWHKPLLHSAFPPSRCCTLFVHAASHALAQALHAAVPHLHTEPLLPALHTGQLHAYRLRIRLPPGGCTLRALSSCKQRGCTHCTALQQRHPSLLSLP